jgi:hypothetical protein
MTFTYDVATDAGKVRLLIKDTDETEPIFQDEEIAAFLEMEGESVHRAAALALETVASDEARTQKVIRLLEIQTDGAKLSDALLARADRLRAQADEAESREEDGMFDIAETVNDDFGARERILKQAQRGQG